MQQQGHQFLINQLYDGLITKKVSMVRVPIQESSFRHFNQIKENRSVQGKFNALKTRKHLSFLGKQYQKIVMPCIPAYEHKVDQKQSEDSFNHFYIKSNQKSQIQAIASGKRSTILQIKDQKDKKKLLRYKGCGNQLKGFNIQISSIDQEIRGCHFYQTSKRQLYMTKLINDLFQSELCICPPANIPMYMFQYTSQVLKEKNIKNELQKIGKYCCIFETQGDRRAGTHLISPLQMIFLSIYSQKNKQNWQQIFKKKERMEQGQLTQFITNFQLIVEEGKTFYQAYLSSTQMSNYLSIQDDQLVLKQNYQGLLKKIGQKFVPNQYKQLYIQKIGSLTNILQLIKLIIFRIGWEMGQIKITMSKHGLSWGFFLDHGKLFHCNAHLNNFIITKPQIALKLSNYFILPLDYDLAYHKQQFFSIEQNSQNYGEKDDNLFESYQLAQYNAMQMSLFGLQIMDFKYGIDQENNELKGQDLKQKKMNRIIFRDSLVKSFIQGMRDNKQFHQAFKKKWDQNISSISNLVQCCLMISLNFET